MITLKPLQAITSAPMDYDYRWMQTVVANIAVDENGRSCRLVQNEDDWHFQQQLLRYGQQLYGLGPYLAIAEQKRLDEFFRHGRLKLTNKPIHVYRIKIDLHQAFGRDAKHRDAISHLLGLWQDTVKYGVGIRMDGYIDCLDDEAAEQLRASLRHFGLYFTPWQPQPE